ncbi:MAG: hypothetical protein CUN57_00575, partial [Phototrophicales bacterium]
PHIPPVVTKGQLLVVEEPAGTSVVNADVGPYLGMSQDAFESMLDNVHIKMKNMNMLIKKRQTDEISEQIAKGSLQDVQAISKKAKTWISSNVPNNVFGYMFGFDPIMHCDISERDYYFALISFSYGITPVQVFRMMVKSRMYRGKKDIGRGALFKWYEETVISAYRRFLYEFVNVILNIHETRHGLSTGMNMRCPYSFRDEGSVRLSNNFKLMVRVPDELGVPQFLVHNKQICF